MTDRVRTLTVVLDRDYRDDDVERIVQTITMIKGVHQVEVGVVTGEQELARFALRGDLKKKLLLAINKVFDPNRT
jgi:hypothetical protein